MKLDAMIAHFKDWELVQAISTAFQKKKEHSSMTNSNENGAMLNEPLPTSSETNTDSVYRSEIEGFVVGDWQDNVAIMLCIKCEQPFNLDPCEDANLVFCPKKKVMVPQCPHCGASDVET